jgi:hypothetical protein
MGFQRRIVLIKRLLFTVILIFLSTQFYSQTTYYVAPTASGGNNSNSGTSLAAPFETLQHAIDQLTAGDILYIREGTYRETITIDEDGSSGNLITIQNYNNEVVTIDGTTDIAGTWSTYNDVSGAYQFSYTGDITQLFVDDQPMVNARWPNAQFNDDSIFSHSTWAEGDEGNSSNGSLTIDTSVHDPGIIDLDGSIGILNIGSFKTWSVEITDHNLATDVITYNSADLGGTYKTKHHYYFFEGKKEFIDTNNEWFHDKANNKLYLFPDDGSDPSNRSIKAKTTDYRVTFSAANYVKLQGINFFATTFQMTGNSDNNIIEECNFYFPSASQRMLGTTNGLGTPNVTSIEGSADNNHILKCLFENSEGEALRIKGDYNKVENNYFHHIDWSVSQIEGLMVSIFFNGVENIFDNNSIHTTGASATVLPGQRSIFSYNNITNTGLLQSDGAVFQGTSANVSGSVVHHNYVYDTEKYAFRYDAPGGDAAAAGGYGIMHHNIADNTNGLMIKGNNQIIAHNTIINTQNNKNDIVILSEDCSNTNTWLFNNLAEKIGAHRSATSFSLSANSPMPIAGNVGGSDYGYLKDDNGTDNNSDDDFWRVCVNGDTYYNATAGVGSAQNNIDQINISRTGLTYNADVESLINYNSADGKTESDYQPTSNTIIDQGVSLSETPSGSSTYGPSSNFNYTPITGSSRQMNELIPHTNAGSGADVGAFEVGESWTTGINWVPKFHTTIWKKTAASTDWNSSSNWSTGYVPTSDVNVIIPTGATRYPEISNTGAVSKNITLNTSASLTINKGFDLTIAGNFTNRGTVTLNSDADEFASIIVEGTSSGNITYNRYVNTVGTDEWDLIGSPVDGLSISSFVTTNTTGTATLPINNTLSPNAYAIGIYDNSNNTWTNFTTASVGAAGNFDIGKGYQMASVNGGTGLLKFTGTVATTAQTQAIIDNDAANAGAGRRWSLIANPFPSYVNVNDDAHASNNFITVNSDKLHDTYEAVYGYDADGTGYTVYNHTYNSNSAVYLAPGQAFMVASDDTSSDNVSFTTAMRTISGGDDFAIGDDDYDSQEVVIKLYNDNTEIEETRFYFEEGLSLGLDPGYDAGAFSQSAAIMSRLVEEDQGHGLVINAMGTESMNNAIIPLVINQEAYQDFKVVLFTHTIPDNVNVYLEDNQQGIMTLLNEQDFELTPENTLSEVGRFYLHLTEGTFSIDEEVLTNNLNVFKADDNNFITVEGLAVQSDVTDVKLYNILGMEVLSTSLSNNTNTQTISTDGLAAGVYVIKLDSGSHRLIKKLIIH